MLRQGSRSPRMLANLSRKESPANAGRSGSHRSPLIRMPEQPRVTPPKSNPIHEYLPTNENMAGRRQQQEALASRKLSSHHNPYGSSPKSQNPVTGYHTYNNDGVVMNENTLTDCQNGGRPLQNNTMNVLNSHKADSAEQQILKLKHHYERQLKIWIEGHMNETATKHRNLEKEKTYWRENYNKIKAQFEGYLRAEQEARGRNQAHIQAARKQREAQLQKSQAVLKQELQNALDSRRVAQEQLARVSKLKQQQDIEIVFLRQENRKANCRIFEQQYEIDLREKQIRSLRQSIHQLKQSILKYEAALFEANCKIKAPAEPKTFPQSHPSQRLHCSRPRSSSRHSKNKLAASMDESTELSVCLQAPKEAQKYKHACRRMDRAIATQNELIMVEGIQKLNQKYRLQQNSPSQGRQPAIVTATQRSMVGYNFEPATGRNFELGPLLD